MERERKVVMVPYLAFGHMMPFYQLSLALVKHGFHVYYISTPNNISRLPAPPHTLSHLLHFVPFPMPLLPTCPLPIGAEATVDLAPEMVPRLAEAYDLLRQPVKEFVASLSPDWLIIDFLAHWMVDIGRELSVPVLCFSAFAAATKLFFGPPQYLIGEGRKRVRSTVESLTKPPPWVDFPSKVAFKHFEAFGTLMGFYGGEKPPADRICKSLEGCRAVAIRTCNEFEGEYLHAYAKALGKPVIPTGLLAPQPTKKTNFTDEKWIDSFRWLDNEKEKSVTFVGFGSECKLKREEIHEIARGLELSGLPFLWALRKPSWAVLDDDTDLFPRNFLQNTSKRGRVCIGWAPQMEILAHSSVGASLFHSGWGSVIETIQFGHRLVVLPMMVDQGLNARLLVEKGLAVEVERGEDGSFSAEGIAKALREAVVAGDGDESLRKAAAVASDHELQEKYVYEFVKFLET